MPLFWPLKADYEQARRNAEKAKAADKAAAEKRKKDKGKK
jgi:hypothetical protein